MTMTPAQSVTTGLITGAMLLLGSAFLPLISSATVKTETSPRDVELVALSKDPARVRLGKRLYAGTCLQCHGDEKNGVDAPSNLFDAKWYHGDLPTGIERNIAEGILEKGMPAWKEALAPEDIAALAAYLINKQPPKPATP